MNARRYAVYGILLGLMFPVVGNFIRFAQGGFTLDLAGARAANADPLLLIIWSAPLFLGALASYAGRHQDQILALEAGRREAFLKTASELFGSAQALLSTVSSFSSMTAETAASVRETTATMGQLGQTATHAALTAETVIGMAQSGARCSEEGLRAVDASMGELVKLADEVRGLSERIEALNLRMRDIFEIATVVNYVADRSQRLADHANAEAQKAGPAARGFADVVAEMRLHSDDSKKAAAQVKGILSEVHKAMLSAMTAAEVGVRRAEQGAQVASSTGETIRRLATTLRDSSQAAKEIATVAQQQDHGIDQVLKAMNEIYLATQETMTSTQAVAQQAKGLNDLAQGLKKQVER
ncbi:MAG TPA: methyl-accepting chemotaxis protein [Anaeromyxobacteraceae bacterium]|nr:methyl-accepting chemotaxis protein [Anaeromyxobacteraceae bacterium]